MIAVRALDDTEIVVNKDAVTLVAGPYPHDLGPHTYVHGVELGVLVTIEDAAALVARLGVDPPFGKADHAPINRRFGSRDPPSARFGCQLRRNSRPEER